MKHRRGIDLSAPVRPSAFREHDPRYHDTLKSLREWEVVGAKCAACGRISWLDKSAIQRQLGDQYLMNLRYRLRCECGNKEGNLVLIGALDRNV